MMGASSSSTNTVCPGAVIRVLPCACSRDRDPQARCTDDGTALQLTQSLIDAVSVHRTVHLPNLQTRLRAGCAHVHVDKSRRGQSKPISLAVSAILMCGVAAFKHLHGGHRTLMILPCVHCDVSAHQEKALKKCNVVFCAAAV